MCVIMGVPLLDMAAGFADEKLGHLTLMTVIAGDERVDRFDTMDQSQA